MSQTSTDPSALAAAPAIPRANLATGILLAISLSHLLNDLMQSLVPAVYPILKAKFSLDFGQVGLISLTFYLTASLLQPVVGIVTDRRPMPFSLAVGMGSTLAGLLLLSVAGSFQAILLAAGLIGLGSAVFHPESSRVARMASGGRHGLAQSVFQVGGNAGSAIGPLLAAFVVVRHGQSSIAWFSGVALLAMAVLAMVGRWYGRRVAERRRAPEAAAAAPSLPRARVVASVAILLLLIFSKYFYMASLSTYYTFYLIDRFHVPVDTAQLLLFVFLGAVAVGTVVGGPMGDRFGRKRVIWTSILGVLPFTLVLPHANLLWTTILTVPIGLILASAFSAILVYAQDLLPGRVGLVGGLFFGFAFGMGGLGAAVLGELADATSIEHVYALCAYLPAIGLLTAFLPDMRRTALRGSPLADSRGGAAGSSPHRVVSLMHARPVAGRSAEGARMAGPFRSTVCPHDCPSTCALEVEVLDRARIGAVRGAADNTYTAGVICAKVARYAERVHHPGRLLRPLIRTGAKGGGTFREASWEEALDRVAAALADVAARHGPEAVWPYYFAGTMGLVQRDGINRLRHIMRYSRQHNTICSTASESGWVAGIGRYGGPDPREMAEADLIVMWGGNPVSTQVNVMTHVTRARKQRGATFVVVDPYRTPSAVAADIHLAPRPGTDGALACAVMHVLFRDGHADREYMARYADCPDRLEAHLRDRGPAWAAGITGLTVAEIEGFAALYGRTDRAFLRIGYGFSRSRNGSANLHAVTCLPTVGGKWQHPGGGAFWNNRGNGIYHWDKTLIEGLDALDPGTRRMDMSRIGAVLAGDPAELGAGPPVHALFIQNTNPVVVAPDSNRVRRGFLRDDLFVCVHEQFMTETAALADVVLPATMFLEHDDLYAAGGHTHLQVGPKLIDPPGECRSNHEVLQGLARRLGARHPGFEMTAMQMVDATLRASGWPGAEEVLARRWIDADEGFERSHFLTGFGFPDGRFRFAPDWAAVGPHHAGMPALPDHWAATDEAMPGHPFRLVAAPARQFLNTSFTETPGSRKREGRPTALVHPDDAARLGIVEGGRVTLGNAQGTVTVHARLVAGLQPGVVVVESVWPNADFTGGVGINALTSDAPAAPNGGAVFHDTAVWMRAEPGLALAAE